MKYYLIAGEASGDLHASRLMKALGALDPEAQFRCLGGDLMAQAGGTLVKHYREMAYMGFGPVITHLPTIFRNMARCKSDILAWKPDAVVLVDYPGFNLRMARFVHSRTHARVFYYIPPKIWAWKGWRIRSIRRYVDAVFSILPFEPGVITRSTMWATPRPRKCGHSKAITARAGRPSASASASMLPSLSWPCWPVVASRR